MSDPREVIARAIFEAPYQTAEDDCAPAAAILSALSEAGYVVVPRQPTQAMVNAALADPGGIMLSIRAALAAGTTTPRTGDERG